MELGWSKSHLPLEERLISQVWLSGVVSQNALALEREVVFAEGGQQKPSC